MGCDRAGGSCHVALYDVTKMAHWSLQVGNCHLLAGVGFIVFWSTAKLFEGKTNNAPVLAEGCKHRAKHAALWNQENSLK